MLHHDFSRAVIKDRVARFQDEAGGEKAEKSEEGDKERPGITERSERTGRKSGFLRAARSLPRRP